jgi:hypothetical protein
VRGESGPTDQLGQFVRQRDDQRFDIFSDSTVEGLFDADHPEVFALQHRKQDDA